MKRGLFSLLVVVVLVLVGCKAKEETPPPVPESVSSPAPAQPVTTPNGVTLPANSIAAQDFRDGKK